METLQITTGGERGSPRGTTRLNPLYIVETLQIWDEAVAGCCCLRRSLNPLYIVETLQIEINPHMKCGDIISES